MFSAFVKLYNFSSLSTCSMLSSNSTTSLPSQHVQCFRQTLQLLFPLNSLTKTLNMLRVKRSCRVWRKHWTCWEGREVVELDESIGHVGREEKLATSLPSQHVQCFRHTLQLLFPLNMFNAFVKPFIVLFAKPLIAVVLIKPFIVVFIKPFIVVFIKPFVIVFIKP
jgi:hypothetical protein